MSWVNLLLSLLQTTLRPLLQGTHPFSITQTGQGRVLQQNQYQDTESEIQVNEDAQLDIVLPFLQSVPFDAFLSTHTNSQGDVFLLVVEYEPASTNQELARSILAQLIQRTVDHFPLPICTESIGTQAAEKLKSIELPLKAGPVRCALSSISISFASANTSGQYCVPLEIPLRTPTECLAVLLDILDAATATSDDQQTVIKKVTEQGETSRVRNRMDIECIKSLMSSAKSDFAAVGLHQLETEVHSLLKELRGHGPSGPPKTRLLDNVYGRVWETTFNSALVDDMPPKVLESARIIRKEFAEAIKHLPADVQQTVCKKFTTLLKDQLPRSWLEKDSRLVIFGQIEDPSIRHLEQFLQAATTSGHEAVGDYFVAIILFDALKNLEPNPFPWRIPAQIMYDDEIVPLKGSQKFRERTKERSKGSGLTLAHQPPVSNEQVSLRAVTTRVWDLDTSRETDVESANMLALRSGIPYGSGISGYTILFVTFFLEIKKQKDFDASHAILGLFIFFVHDGGHTWNEGLQTLNLMERRFGLDILPRTSDPATYVSDYSEFISIFDKTETKGYIERAVQQANKMTISYRRKYYVSR